MIRTEVIRQLAFFILMLSFFVGNGQSEADSTRYDEVRSLVNFYQYMLNFVGSSQSSARDKEVIITESYKKIFNTQDVQIEDDLILDRKVITNKDVSAYLRDVDFFFKDIQFDFGNIEIEKMANDDDAFYYLASFEGIVNGITIDDEVHSNSKKRFIEVNIDVEENDLKIASVYSTKVSRNEELKSWWAGLSLGWMTIFKDYMPFDSISNSVLVKIAAIDSLNLSGNQYILNLEPLVALSDLEILDISNSKITDITPLRYARNLRKLKAANTPINDITALQYFDKLTYLDLSQTEVVEISTIERLKKLTFLNLSNTKIISFEPLRYLNSLDNINLSSTIFSDPTLLSANTSLQEANLSRTPISQLSVFKDLTMLKQLDVSETGISSINGLEGHPKLEILTINQTIVNQLNPLMSAPNLKKVYADFTGISEKMAFTFMANKFNTVVVTNSEEVMEWWSTLPTNWKNVFSQIIHEDNPGKEDFIKLMNLDSLDLSNKYLFEIEPLKKFKRLRYLDVSKNQFTSFDFTEEMVDLEFLKGLDLPVKSTLGLEKNISLRFLILNGSSLEDMRSLSTLDKLELLDADHTNVDEVQIVKYLNSHPKTVIIYQSEELKYWWSSLPQEWKNALKIDGADAYHLHQLIEQEKIAISNQAITSLAPLNLFINLKQITLDRILITGLDELYGHQGLRQLSCTNSPLSTLEGFKQLNQLEFLDISNTAIEDLKDLVGLSSLKHLNCAGTGIKNLKSFSALFNLEGLNVSNTRIWRLEKLYSIRNLKTLICNNTRLTKQKVANFQELFPDCKISFY